MLALALLMLHLAAAPPAKAPPGTDGVVEDHPTLEAPRNYVNFRVGASTRATRPQLCLSASPLDVVGIEACGTGGGFLHQEPGTDLTHFRGKLRLASTELEGAWIEPWVAVGFAELEVAPDTPGFVFTGTNENGASTAGPDIGASVRALLPLGAGVELVGEVGVGVAYFVHAPLLVVPQHPVQPQASVNLGIGF